MNARVIAVVYGAILFLGVGCYRGTPPCRPGTVDYPRCNDVTLPPFGARGAGGASAR